MPVIEGVGDEVFQVLLIALGVLLGVVAWWSTSISEQPLIRTVLILEPRIQANTEIASNILTTSPPQDTGQPASTASNEVHVEPVPVPNASNTSKDESQRSPEPQAEAAGAGPAGSTDPGTSSTHSTQADESAGDTDISPTSIVPEEVSSEMQEPAFGVSSSPNELRRRRLQFFEERQGADNATDACSRPPVNPLKEIQDCPDATSSSSSNQESSEVRDSQTESEETSSDPCLACDDIRIKLKFLNDNQKLVQGKLQEPLGDFKRRNFSGEMSARKVIRLIFNGQVLQSDDRTLQNYGLFDNCVVHCLVHNQRTSSSNVNNATNSSTGEDAQVGGPDAVEMREWDMSHIMYVSIFIILSAIWYLRINFAHLFSATSSVALFVLSVIFVILLVGTYIPDQNVIRT